MIKVEKAKFLEQNLKAESNWDFSLIINPQDVLLLTQFISPEGLVIGSKKTGRWLL